MRAKDIMSRPVHTVRDADSIEDAAALLSGHNITAAPVVDASGELVGMVSESDLLWHRVPADPTAHAWRDAVRGQPAPERPKQVDDVMSADPRTAWPDEDVADVAEVMLRHNVRSMPVVDRGVIVGIVSRRDILRSLVRTDDVLRQEIEHRLDEYAGGQAPWDVVVATGTATVTGPFRDDAERSVVAILARTVPGVVAAHTA